MLINMKPKLFKSQLIKLSSHFKENQIEQTHRFGAETESKGRISPVIVDLNSNRLIWNHA